MLVCSQSSRPPDDLDAPPNRPDPADERGSQEELEQSDDYSEAVAAPLAAADLVADGAESGQDDVEEEEEPGAALVCGPDGVDPAVYETHLRMCVCAIISKLIDYSFH